MRGALALVAVGLAGATCVPAAAGTTTYREVTANYVTGGVDGVVSGGSQVQGEQSGSAIVIPTAGNERTAAVTLSDRTGRLAAARVAQDTDGDGQPDVELGTVCGGGTVHLPVPGKALIVYAVLAACPQQPARTTQGVARIRLSR